jgi:D-alanyl-D-alanine carboxypeptidase
MKKIILSLFLALQLACTPLLSLTAQSAPITYEAGISQNAAKKADDNKKTGDTLTLSAPSVLLMEAKSGTIIYEKDANKQMPPASITKIMTALLAMEYNQPDTQVTITEEDLALEDGSQMSGLAVGDTVTMDQLFHALLIYSANDAAMAIARQVGGSVENFVQMMNDKAASLAMTGTHFANPHGLHDENHYTTAYDVYLMLYAAYQHTEFQNTMSMSSYTLNMTHADGTAGTIYLSSTDKYLTGEKNAPENVTVLGGKTGTTDEAGSCLALVSQNAYGEPFISVILHASTKVELYEDMNTLLSNINS